MAVASAASAAVLLVYYLVKRPPLVGSTKLMMLAGLGVLPILCAGSANVQGFQSMETRTFCGSCHVMEPYEDDSNDATSTALAALHARNHNFGEENCYTCHKEYGMYGFVLTKMGGMRHVYYQLTEYHRYSLEEARHKIHINKPMANSNCMSCHTTEGPRWLTVPDHASSLELVRTDAISCASAGCHGYAHPWTKNDAMPLPRAASRK